MQHKSGEEKAMVVLRNSTIAIRDAQDVARVFQDLLRLEDRIDQDVAIGTLTHTAMHPWETFRRAVIEGSDSIVVAHIFWEGMPMEEYIIRDISTQGMGINPESPAFQAMLCPLLELVSAIFAEQSFGQAVTIELTLKITPAPRGSKKATH
jgi:hypothetical protein